MPNRLHIPFIFLVVALLGACTVRDRPIGRLFVPRQSIPRALSFLATGYNPDVGLIRESPIVAPHRYWLATDNQLAVYALTPYSPTLASQIQATIDSYPIFPHGLIEVLAGDDVAWPPRTETQQRVAVVGDAEIWTEHRLSGPRYQDWADYADLAFLGALDALNEGQVEKARRRYRAGMAHYDGVGFADKAQQAQGLYATYKLALALYTAKHLDEPVEPALLSALLAKQGEDGGFVTLYNRDGPQGDASTETTAYAILALHVWEE